MRLSSTPKPVKIRITCDGVEHNSLESLREHLVYADFAKLLDGGLDKWLRRIGFADKADKISFQIADINDNVKKTLTVFDILFDFDHKFHFQNLNEVVLKSFDDKRILKFAQSLFPPKECEDPSAFPLTLDWVVDQREKCVAQFRPIYDRCLNWLLRERVDADKISDEDIFKIGKMLFENEMYKELGKKCIYIADKNNLHAATSFIQEKIDNQHKKGPEHYRLLIFKELRKESVQTTLKNSWAKKKEIFLPQNSPALKALYEFSNTCLGISKRATGISRHDNPFSSDKTYSLFFEKQFVRAIFCTTFVGAEEILESITDYPPAKALLAQNVRESSISIQGHRFACCRCASNAWSLGFFVRNLELFYNYGK